VNFSLHREIIIKIYFDQKNYHFSNSFGHLNLPQIIMNLLAIISSKCLFGIAIKAMLHSF